tara:strand:- start:157 stop:387 length:231 start_codon:yes stop_codon:yes gene_type:complete
MGMEVPTLRKYRLGGLMKIKLKNGEKLSSMNNYCELDYDSWVALNQGKTVELSEVPELIKEKIEEVNSTSSKKGGK